MQPDRPPRVVIVDDREPDRDDLRRALERGGIVVAGTRAALAAPGPVVMLVAPHAVAGILADPSARVLVLAGGDPGYGLDDALRAGAIGFVRRTAPARDLVDVVLAAADGRALRAPVTGPVQAAVAQPATMSSFSATAGEPSARW